MLALVWFSLPEEKVQLFEAVRTHPELSVARHLPGRLRVCRVHGRGIGIGPTARNMLGEGRSTSPTDFAQDRAQLGVLGEGADRSENPTRVSIRHRDPALDRVAKPGDSVFESDS